MARNVSVPGRAGADAARRAFNIRFIGDAISELRRVTWPTRQETMRLSIMVVAVAAAVGLFLGAVDMGFAQIIDVIVRR